MNVWTRVSGSLRWANRWPVVLFAALLSGLLVAPTQASAEVALLALFENKALLLIDGERRLLQTGELSPEGLKLISADTDQALIEVGGREEVLKLGMATVFPGVDAEPDPAWDGPKSISLWADSDGFFYSSGTINGFPVKFLVDTGATSVAISSVLARRIGIDISKAQKGLASTAGGVAPIYRVHLDRVDVGGITLSNVEAGVVVGAHPLEPLLGMSFLGQLDMVREGNRMDLKQRY